MKPPTRRAGESPWERGPGREPERSARSERDPLPLLDPRGDAPGPALDLAVGSAARDGFGAGWPRSSVWFILLIRAFRSARPCERAGTAAVDGKILPRSPRHDAGESFEVRT